MLGEFLGAVFHVGADFHERIVHRRLLHVLSLTRASSSSLSRITLPTSSKSCSEGAIARTERMNARTKSLEQEDERAHKVLGAVGVEQGAHHLRCLHRADFLHVKLNVLGGQVVRIEVVREVVGHVEAVAHTLMGGNWSRGGCTSLRKAATGFGMMCFLARDALPAGCPPRPPARCS